VTSDKPETTYHAVPLLQAPVWTWQIGAYLFIGGAAGMSAVIAAAALAAGHSRDLMRTAILLAFAGAVLSPVLLIWDLGRPSRFLNMLRVFKWRSAMSVGVWTLVLFGAFTSASFVTGEFLHPDLDSRTSILTLFFVGSIAGGALTGSVLATYTGVLLGATAVPVWSRHHRLLPVHFGVVAMGSAAALLELIGFRLGALHAIGLAASAVVVAIGGSIELRHRGQRDRALRTGRAGWLLRGAGALTGPLALMARLSGTIAIAASCFVLGAILSRYGWLLAGRASTLDPAETLTVAKRRSS
jgi:hypothetical protein